MNLVQTEYEQKKEECWEEFKEKHFNGNAPWSPYSAFDFTFDRAYALGKQEQKKPKRMCLRDKSKVCNRCHECDIDPDEWVSRY